METLIIGKIKHRFNTNFIYNSSNHNPEIYVNLVLKDKPQKTERIQQLLRNTTAIIY